MTYMATFTINIPQMLAYLYIYIYMNPMGIGGFHNFHRLLNYQTLFVIQSRTHMNREASEVAVAMIESLGHETTTENAPGCNITWRN